MTISGRMPADMLLGNGNDGYPTIFRLMVLAPKDTGS
jgi:hypothetical protein